jgi:hypothetical protein
MKTPAICSVPNPGWKHIWFFFDEALLFLPDFEVYLLPLNCFNYF